MVSVPITDSKSIKDHILEIIIDAKCITVMKLKNILLKKYNQRVSYQAVHKAVKGMYKSGILIRMGKEYVM